MKETYEFLKNGLLATIDWIAFTVTTSSMSLEDVVTFMGYKMSQFAELPRGGMGYKSMIKLDGYPITILYNGKEDMGIHVSITGSAIKEAVRAFKETLICDTPFGLGYDISSDSSVLVHYLSAIRGIGHFSRIDLSIDDIGCQYFSMDDLFQAFTEHRIVSKFRHIQNIVKSSISGEKEGHTIYFGSRKSDIFLRVYDKKLEQSQKYPDRPITYEWIRWEFELSDDRALSAVDHLISSGDIGTVILGLLSNYMRIILLDNNNKSRCSVDSMWSKFIADVEHLSLYVADNPKSLDDKERWLKTQCMPTLAAFIVAKHGDLGIIYDNFDDYLSRMSKDMFDLVKASNPDWKGGVALR